MGNSFRKNSTGRNELGVKLRAPAVATGFFSLARLNVFHCQEIFCTLLRGCIPDPAESKSTMVAEDSVAFTKAICGVPNHQIITIF
jgi:hypothetical protein